MRFTIFLTQRLGAGVLVVILSTLAVFLFLRLAPGDLAVLIVAGPTGAAGIDMAKVEEVRRELGLDRPLIVQFAHFAYDFVRGEWGNSYWTGRPLGPELRARIPVTIEIALFSELVAWIIAVPAGIISAMYRGSVADAIVRLLVVVGLSIPVFWLGTLVLLALLLWVGWTPPLGIRTLSNDPMGHLQQVGPAVLCFGYVLSASLARLIRSEVLDVLGEPYVQVARAKGLTSLQILRRHVLRNALMPALTYSSLRVGFLLGGAVVVETVFNIPGMGRYLVDAVLHRDYPAVQIVVAMLACIFVAINIIVDLAYLYLDPRLRG